MEEMKNMLTADEMKNVSGGTLLEFHAYCKYLEKKYNTKVFNEYIEKSTYDEKHYLYLLQEHKNGEPLPECPNPDFNLKEWIKRV